jgi:hypothetical protein
MGGAVPPLPQYTFMAWCSVRGSTVMILDVFESAVCLQAFAEPLNLLEGGVLDFLHGD